jgi:hypothetical protein
MPEGKMRNCIDTKGLPKVTRALVAAGGPEERKGMIS